MQKQIRLLFLLGQTQYRIASFVMHFLFYRLYIITFRLTNDFLNFL